METCLDPVSSRQTSHGLKEKENCPITMETCPEPVLSSRQNSDGHAAEANLCPIITDAYPKQCMSMGRGDNDGWFLTDDELGRMKVTSCMPNDDCKVWFLMCRPYCTLNRRRFGLRMIGRLLTLPASCVFPLRLYASLPWMCDWPFSRMTKNCLSLRPPDDWSLILSPASSLQLVFVTISYSTMTAFSFLELAEEDCFWHAYVFHSCDVASPVQLHLKQDGLYAGQAGSLEGFFV